MWKTSNLHQRLQRQVLKDLDLTPTQFSLLACYFFLNQINDSVSQSDVCNQAGLDKMLVSDITKALLKKKFLSKKANPEDKRSSLIQVTQLGAEVCNQALKIVEDLDQKFFARAGDRKSYLAVLRALSIEME